jgi:hypothetical protein
MPTIWPPSISAASWILSDKENRGRRNMVLSESSVHVDPSLAACRHAESCLNSCENEVARNIDRILQASGYLCDVGT